MVPPLLAFLLTGNAVAAPPALWGYGVRDCADYLRAVAAHAQGEDGEYRRYEDWLTGFISGLNLATGEDALAPLGLLGAMRQAENFCRGQPRADFFAAAADLIRAARQPSITKP